MAMIMKRHALFSCILASLTLTGCGGEGTITQAGLCADLEGATYYSTTLEESGATPDGINLGHWQIQFSQGEAQLFQSDFGLIGSYVCTEEQVVLTLNEEEQVLEFSDDLSKLQFNPLAGEPLTYVRSEGARNENFGACDQVRGKTYSLTAGTPESDEEAPELVTSSDMYITFGEGQTVDLNLGGSDSATSGIYECSMGELHVHEDSDDETPVVLAVSDDGTSLTFSHEGREYELVSDTGGGEVCLEIYAPVCGIEQRDIQCVTTPCYTEFYKTYSNECYARRAEAPIVHEGECGEKEGEPRGERACTREYDPVCAAQSVTEPCLSAPCPKLEYKTFGNQCEADSAGAIFLFEGECGDKDGEVVSDFSEYMACPAVYDPVCAKDLGNVQCITTPCPTHQYRTFGNACEARVSGASFIAEGECPEPIAGDTTTEEPPVVLVEELPETSKSPRIIESKINGDVLTVTLGYSGCSEQHFSLNIHDAFLESLPVQVRYVFEPMVEDLCDAYFETEFAYDLMPLRLAYSRSYGGSGEIVIPDLGTYTFEVIEIDTDTE